MKTLNQIFFRTKLRTRYYRRRQFKIVECCTVQHFLYIVVHSLYILIQTTSNTVCFGNFTIQTIVLHLYVFCLISEIFYRHYSMIRNGNAMNLIHCFESAELNKFCPSLFLFGIYTNYYANLTSQILFHINHQSVLIFRITLKLPKLVLNE